MYVVNITQRYESNDIINPYNPGILCALCLNDIGEITIDCWLDSHVREDCPYLELCYSAASRKQSPPRLGVNEGMNGSQQGSDITQLHARLICGTSAAARSMPRTKSTCIPVHHTWPAWDNTQSQHARPVTIAPRTCHFVLKRNPRIV